MTERDNHQLLKNITYRPDIDGLRAIAVLSVIVFHVNPAYLPGGFLGVDIFLVISGYLITLLLFDEIRRHGSIDFSAFYQRRIKRLFPALVFTISMTLAAGFILLQPIDYIGLLKSSIWSIFFAANIHFQQVVDVGYFAADSRELPLLHLWSLGVEEQFYLLWPVCLFFVSRKIQSRRWVGVLLFAVTTASLLLAQHLLEAGNNFAYFMLPTRAWELLTGSVIALLSKCDIFLLRRASIREACSWLGFLLLFSSVALLTGESLIPGFDAVPVILGAALLIVSGAATLPGKLLSLPALRLTGLLSYSAYLLHWPILAFTHYSLIEINHQVGLLVIVATFLLAAFCYHYIEKPFRHHTLTASRTFLFYFFIPVTFLSLYAAYMINTISSGNRVIDNVREYQALYLKDSQAGMNISCLTNRFSSQQLHEDRCVIPYQATPSVLLAGDSNANQFLGMLSLFSRNFNFSFRNVSLQLCPLLFSGAPGKGIEVQKENCQLFRETMRQQIANYQTIIVGTDWDYHYLDKPDAFEKDLRFTVNELAAHGRTVILLAKIPVMNGYKYECQLRKNRFREQDCEAQYSNIWSPPSPLNAILRKVAGGYPNVHVFDVRDVICQGNQCSAYLDGKPAYLDSTHLSQTGSLMIGDSLLKQRNSQLDEFRNIGSH